MSLSVIVCGIVVILVLVSGIAFALYKAGFIVDKIKAKLPMVEMEASRKKAAANDRPADLQAGPKIRQSAQEGGVITESGITVPADSAVDVNQQAKGQKSKIDDSPIKLT